jgi:hypothetical protein
MPDGGRAYAHGDIITRENNVAISRTDIDCPRDIVRLRLHTQEFLFTVVWRY